MDDQDNSEANVQNDKAPTEHLEQVEQTDPEAQADSTNVALSTQEQQEPVGANSESQIQETPVQQTQPTESTEATASSVAEKKISFKLSKKLVLVILGVLVIVAGGIAFYLLQRNDKTSTNSTQQDDVSEQTNQETTVEEPVKAIENYVLGDAEFSGTMEEYPYQPVFTDAGLAAYYFAENENDTTTYVKYYKIGVDNGNDILLAILEPSETVWSYQHVLLLKDGDSYTIYDHHSMYLYNEGNYYAGPELASNVKIDQVSAIKKLVEKDTINYAGVVASKTGTSRFLEGDSLSDLQEIETIDEGVVYEKVVVNDYHKGVKQFSIFLKQPSGLYVPYRYTTEVLNDDNTVAIDWNDGTKTTETYDWAMIRGGCGVVDSVNVLDKSYFNDLEQIGQANGEPVYRLKSKDHVSFKSVYSSYNYDGTREGAVSADEFYDNNGMIVVRNKLGYRVILVNNKYQSGGECGKPVIYLYPEEPTEISVGVDADIAVSIPEYGNGWKNVLAMPNGQLFLDGQEYPYLFWEGVGHGLYPEINEGFIVENSNIEDTLRSHLTLQGLNDKESADFMEFWLPLMPDTPYIRLTWFSTAQMNELAPLTLSKKPDTLIRVFLDFQGLEAPIALKEQRLSHPPRKGFVVTEWGGLRFVY